FLVLAAGYPVRSRDWLMWLVTTYPGDPVTARARQVMLPPPEAPSRFRDVPEGPPPRHSYRLAMGGVYVVSIALLAAGIEAGDGFVGGAGSLLLAFGPPILHFAHHNGGAGGMSLLTRALFV